MMLQILPVSAVEPSQEDLNFHVFLAEYLDENTMLDRLDQPMAHQFMHAAMQEEFGETNAVLTLTHIANDWGHIIKGQSGIYEQVILEMLVNHVNSDVFKQRIDEDRVNIEFEILEYIKTAFDFDYLKDDYQEIYSIVSRIDFKTWKDVSKIPGEVINKNLANFVKHFEIPVSDSYILNVGYDFYDFLMKVITYKSVCNQMNGMVSVLEEMLRYSKDSDMRVAIANVLSKVEAARSVDLWALVEANRGEIGSKLTSTLAKDIFITSLGLVGLAIETGGFISNAVFKTDVIAESYILLKSEIAVENVIKDVIRTKQNTYLYNKKDAKTLNTSLILLYDAYEYGTEITKKYGQSVYKAAGQLFGKELYIKFFQNSLNINFNEKTYSFQEFLNTMKTWEGIIKNDRTLFESGWNEYRNLMIHSMGSIEDVMDDNAVHGIYFENNNVTIDINEDSLAIPLTACKNMPNNIPLSYAYTSSDPSIVSIENEHIYSVTPHKPGTVTVVAKTEDGLFSATQQITVIDSTIESNPNIETDQDYSDYYEENEDGITLTGFIPDYLEIKEGLNYIYHVPSNINGKTVTEVDFSKIKLRENGGNTNYINKVILPDSVKRIADHCFSGDPDYHHLEIVLPEGLEEIGQKAFKFTIFNQTELILPSTLKSIGEHAFSSVSIDTIYVDCPNLQEIPGYCFSGEIRQVLFSNEMEQLKKIKEFAFSGVDYVLLPDCVEVLNEKACFGTSLDQLPSSLIEIGNNCFQAASLSFNQLPSNVKQIGDYAFSGVKTITTISIPSTVEFIGKAAFDNVLNVILYDNGIGNQGEIIENAGYYSYFEIPYSITKIGKYFHADHIVWTNGLDEIEIEERIDGKVYGQDHSSLYCHEIDREGSYALKNHIFDNDSYFDVIEIPVNYLENTKMTLSGDWIKECIIVGDAEEDELKKYVEILKDAIDTGGSITYRDPQGNLILLYQNLPLSYNKESKFIYENQKDYLVTPIEQLRNEIHDQVRDLQVSVSSDSVIQGVHLQCWKEENESLSERADALGNFMIFEDVYLEQPYYRYFTIETESQNKGPYVVSVEVELSNLNEDNAGLYHINRSGRITRIPIHFEYTEDYNRRVTFKTDELGQFALVQLQREQKKIPYSYRKEYQYLDEERTINKDTKQEFENDESNAGYAGEGESETVVIKPLIDKKTKEEFVDHLGLDGSLINRDEKETEVTDQAVEDAEKFDKMMDRLVEIQPSDKGKIQLSLDKLEEDKQYQFYLYTVNEDNTIEEAELDIKSVKANQVNPILQEANHEYYEMKLKKGNYYFTYTIEMAEETESVNPMLLIRFPCIILLLLMGLIFSRKGKRK